MKRYFAVLILTLFFGSGAHAWTLNADFEGGTLGVKADAPNGYNGGAMKYTVFSNKHVQTGTRAAEMSINQGTTAFGQWGAQMVFPTALGEGDEVWYRANIYFPAGFNFWTDSGALKTLRLHTHSSSGANEGYLDTAISTNCSGLTVWSEVDGPDFNATHPQWQCLGRQVPTGTWHTLELYAKLSATPGKAIYRAWQDGVLVLEDTTNNTLRSSSSKSDFVYIFSYWNGGAPATQSAYVDNFTVTTDRPSQTDSHGNPMIGLVGGVPSTVAPPNPPSIQ